MSQENVEIVRRGTELWLRGDFAGWLETIDPEIGWDISAHPLPDVPNRGQGREAFVTDMLGTYLSGWNDYAAEIKEVSEAGEQVILVLHETATMRETGASLERDLVQLGQHEMAGALSCASSRRSKRPSKPWACRSRDLTLPRPSALPRAGGGGLPT
ncbi:MAG TPA: nuclear transport factor 2 family protein [Thermoleophilaceae bacterium]|nr:nuclear transport factor 2 family protein [Thermoleophilaceae bacterium]